MADKTCLGGKWATCYKCAHFEPWRGDMGTAEIIDPGKCVGVGHFSPCVDYAGDGAVELGNSDR